MKRTAVLLAAVAVGFLIPREASAYRTAADLPDLAGAERVRWQPARVEYEVNDQGAPGLSSAGVLNAVETAANTWTRETCASVELASLSLTAAAAAPDDGKNTIQWLTSGWLERGFGTETAGITDTLYELGDDSEWRIIEADVYLDAEHLAWSFSPGADNTRDIQTVLTHELGHVLGLLHPCEPDGADDAPVCDSDPAFQSATMYPLYDVNQSSLGADDVEGLCFLYSYVACETLGCAPEQICTPEGCAQECGNTVCDVGQVCRDGTCEAPPCIICACASDTDCRHGLRCTDGTCAPGSSPLGDPCTADTDCETQACSASGFCATRCGSDAMCGDGVCSEPAPETGTRACESALGAFGEVCGAPSECLGGECLQVDNHTPVCTRSCGPGYPDCPSKWKCTRVERELVCAPPPDPPPDEGCSIRPRASAPSRSGRSTNGASVALAIVALACAAARRRARRKS
jgi:hypothetical protein